MPIFTKPPRRARIINDFAGSRLDYVVTGYGTGGTVAGLARVLRRERSETRIVLSEPANAQLLGSGQSQERNTEGAPTVSHPAFRPHPIQGWTPDFIPLVLQEVVDSKGYDELIPVTGPDGLNWARLLAQKERILTGISGGSSFAVARQVAERAAPGSVILCMLPDTGERYMTTPLFEAIEAEMDADEIALTPTTINIVCFSSREGDGEAAAVKALNVEIMVRLQEEGIAVLSDTTIKGKHCLRVAITNHRTRREDLTLLVQQVVRLQTDILCESTGCLGLGQLD